MRNNIYLIAMCFPVLLPIQLKSSDCSKIRKGMFYFYPPNSADEYRIFRGDSIQAEVKIGSRDTSYWKINWKNDCLFTLNFIRKNTKLSDAENNFYKSHTTLCKVLDITPDYYVFKAGLDSIKGLGSVTDTLWFKQR